MRRLILLIMLLLIIFNINGQTFFNVNRQKTFNVWDKNKQKINKNFLFESFVSKLPDGKKDIYDKIEVDDILVKTSSGKSYIYKPIIYRSRTYLSTLHYTKKGWQGTYTSDGKRFFNMTPSEIVVDNSLKKIPLTCNSLDTNQQVQSSNLVNADFYNPNRLIKKTCKVYSEVMNSIHISWGSDSTLTRDNVVTIWANSSAIFLREGVKVSLREIFIWDDQVDPYEGLNYSQILTKFRSNIIAGTPTSTTQHFKHLIGKEVIPNGVGIASHVNGQSNGYSNANPSLFPNNCFFFTDVYNGQIPTGNLGTTWSVPVYLFTHELGHVLGSKHTHSCVWYNDQGSFIGSIDSCDVNNCSNAPISNNNGTIMSYCNNNGYVNFNLGFGKYPRYSIRSNLYGSPQIPFDTVYTPILTTIAASNIISDTLTIGGIINDDGGTPTVLKGICWSTSPNPTINNFGQSSSINSDTFSLNIKNLNGNTTYYFRAFLKNSQYTGYGNEITVTTQNGTTPLVTTLPVTNVLTQTGYLNGIINSTGGLPTIIKGICYSISPNPTISDNILSNSFIYPYQKFSLYFSGLEPNTTYYARTYCSNSLGITYGNEIEFKTIPTDSLVIQTREITNKSYNNALTGVNILNSGIIPILSRGVCLSTSPNPTLNNNVFYGLSTTVTYPSSGNQTTYYVRAFLINSTDTVYGNELSFTNKLITQPICTLVTNPRPISVTEKLNNTWTSKIFSSGGATSSINDNSLIYQCLRTSSNLNFQNYDSIITPLQVFLYPLPTLNGIGGFTQNLSPNTKYYQQYKSKNCCFECLSNTDTTITSPPSISSENISNISTNKVRLSFNITNYQNFNINKKGVQYSTSLNNLYFNTNLSSNSQFIYLTNTNTGNTIIENEFNLQPNTTYYMRPFVYYGQYGSQQTYGKIFTVKTISICDVGDLSTQRDLGGRWLFSFKLNPIANKYNLKVCVYKEANPNVQPSISSRPESCYVPNGMTNYYPTTQELASKEVQRLIRPGPNLSNRWYSIEVKSICPECPFNQKGTTKYFYNNNNINDQ